MSTTESSASGYEEENLTHRDHLDPDKHWIGEALPAPSIQELATSGYATGVGESPFPARADHYHDNRFRYTLVRQLTGKACPGSAPGTRTVIDGLTLLAGRDIMNGSGAVLTPARDGLYMQSARIQVNRSTGTFPVTTAYSFAFEFNGASAVRTIEQANLPQARSLFVFPINDLATLPVDGDVQLSYVNFDTVSHTVYISSWGLVRLASSVSA